MKPTRAIAALAVAGALSVAASAQVVEVDPNAQRSNARPVATVQRPQSQTPAPMLTTPNQGAEIVIGGSTGGAKTGGFS
jgi:hypothetical protein